MFLFFTTTKAIQMIHRKVLEHTKHWFSQTGWSPCGRWEKETTQVRHRFLGWLGTCLTLVLTWLNLWLLSPWICYPSLSHLWFVTLLLLLPLQSPLPPPLILCPHFLSLLHCKPIPFGLKKWLFHILAELRSQQVTDALPTWIFINGTSACLEELLQGNE